MKYILQGVLSITTARWRWHMKYILQGVYLRTENFLFMVVQMDCNVLLAMDKAYGDRRVFFGKMGSKMLCTIYRTMLTTGASE